MRSKETQINKENSTLLKMASDTNLPAVTTSKQQIRQMLDIKHLSYEELDAAKIIYPGMQDVLTLNNFRELRNKLIQKSNKQNFTVMISALARGGGGTYVSENLAAAFALDFEKTSLLIDCNFSTPSSEKLLSTSDIGLTDYLDDPRISASDIIYSTGIPRLRMTPVGTHITQSPELLSSDRMEEFLNETKNRYPERYIIIDAPPINSSPDSRVLADLCDFTVLVVPYGKVTRMQISAGINSVPKGKLAGLIFNN